MTKRFKWIFIAPLILTMGAIWFLTPPSNPVWLKHAIMTATIIFQLCLLYYLLKLPVADKEDRYFGLAEKFYSVTLFTAFAVYIKGVWEITPDTNPIWVKHLVLGIGLAVLSGLALFFVFKKVGEKADERFYMNLAKAACLTLSLVLLSLMILSVISFLMPFTLRAGMVLIYGATMIFTLDLSFFFFEKRG